MQFKITGANIVGDTQVIKAVAVEDEYEVGEFMVYISVDDTSEETLKTELLHTYNVFLGRRKAEASIKPLVGKTIEVN